MTLNRHTHLNAIHSFKGEIYALKRKEGGLEFYFRPLQRVIGQGMRGLLGSIK